jgi:hypothetical protein
VIVFGTEDVQQNIYVIFWRKSLQNRCKRLFKAAKYRCFEGSLAQNDHSIWMGRIPDCVPPFVAHPLSIVDGAFLYRVTRRRRLLLTTNTLLKDMAVAARIGLR